MSAADALLEGFQRGSLRALSRVLTEIERETPVGLECAERLYARTGSAVMLGITGSPGVGKSTLVDRMASEWRRQGMRVGIVAVDPSSPYTGGAILGDRIRMKRHFTDEGVFIRSMAARSHLGGLAPTTSLAAAALDAFGFEIVMVETVGVGQDEIDVVNLADVTLLVVSPGMGDDVQMLKAGVVEIADLFVVNKSDTAPTERIMAHISAFLDLCPKSPPPAVVKTDALSGKGVEELVQRVGETVKNIKSAGAWQQRKKESVENEILHQLRQIVSASIIPPARDSGILGELVEKVMGRTMSPRAAAKALLDRYL